jgi:hypothetical protein
LSPILTPSLERTLSGIVTWYFRVTFTSSFKKIHRLQ